jgi:hypothetical protein
MIALGLSIVKSKLGSCSATFRRYAALKPKEEFD